MGNIFYLVLVCSCFIIFAIWYDSNKTKIFYNKEGILILIKLITGLLLIIWSCDIFFNNPEFQYSKRYGFSIHSYAYGLLILLLGAALLLDVVKSNVKISNEEKQKGSKKTKKKLEK